MKAWSVIGLLFAAATSVPGVSAGHVTRRGVERQPGAGPNLPARPRDGASRLGRRSYRYARRAYRRGAYYGAAPAYYGGYTYGAAPAYYGGYTYGQARRVARRVTRRAYRRGYY